MSYGRLSDCDCARDLRQLADQVRSLEYQLDALKRDLEREIDDRRAAVRALANDITDMNS